MIENNFFQASNNNKKQSQTMIPNNMNKAKVKQKSDDNNNNRINNFFSSGFNRNNNNNNGNNTLFSSNLQGCQKDNNQNNNNYINENDNAIAKRMKNKHSSATKILVNECAYKNPKIIKNLDNNTKLFDDSLENDGFEKFQINNDNIDELKENENVTIKQSSTVKIKSNINNCQLVNNNNIIPSERLKKSVYSNIDNNTPENNNIPDNNNMRNNNFLANNKIKNDGNADNNKHCVNRNLSCKIKRKKRIHITNLKYAQDISLEKDKIILFENGLGVNDCFLNAIIQVLFHLEGFKNKLLHMKIDKEEKNPIFQLYTIFQKYEYLSKLNTIETLNASLLREALHNKFGTYPKGKCGDPMETILELLELIHNQYYQTNESSNNENNNFCQNNLCPSHSNFLINLKEMKYCPNCKVKDFQIYDKDCFMYSVLSYEILSTVKKESFYEYKYSLFHKLKQISQSFGDNKIKLEKCKCKEIKTKKKLYLYNKFSPYLIINITWDSNFPKMSDICKIYGLIPIVENNKNLFGFDLEKGKKTENDFATNYYLSSMILYGQNHYTSVFYNKTVGMWSFVDDENKKNFDAYHELVKFLIIRRSIPVGIVFYHLNDFKQENIEKLLLNEEEFNALYKKSLENDQRDLEDKQKMEKDNNTLLKQLSRQQNHQQNNNNIDNGTESLGTEKIVKIKRNKKKNINNNNIS